MNCIALYSSVFTQLFFFKDLTFELSWALNGWGTYDGKSCEIVTHTVHTATQRWPVSTSSNRSTCWLESLDSIQWARSWSSSRTAVADFSGGACEGTVEVAFAAATTCLTRVLPLAANTRWVVAQAKILQQLMIHHIRTFSNRLEGFKGPELLESNSELSSQFLHFRLDIALHFLSGLACSHLSEMHFKKVAALHFTDLLSRLT